MLPIGSSVPITSFDGLPAGPAAGHRIDNDRENAGQEFEAVFTSMIVKELRKTTGGEGLFPGDKSDSLGGLFDMYIGRELASSGSLGIQQMVDTWMEHNADISDQ